VSKSTWLEAQKKREPKSGGLETIKRGDGALIIKVKGGKNLPAPAGNRQQAHQEVGIPKSSSEEGRREESFFQNKKGHIWGRGHFDRKNSFLYKGQKFRNTKLQERRSKKDAMSQRTSEDKPKKNPRKEIGI